jgi:acyl-CoA reductase-like NAD-dependent aldehyde dehydrogenase
MSFESRNPTTGEIIARYPEHTPAQVKDCLERAWTPWRVSWPMHAFAPLR